MRVLVLCTANQCRSPMAEAILRARLADLGVDGEVVSGGRMVGDQPATEGARVAMADRGLDLTGHRSHTCSTDDLRRADLIIGMAREHVRDAALGDRQAFDRTFTLKELVRRGTEVGSRPVSEEIADWIDRVHVGRTHAGLLGSSDLDDIADPMGGPLGAYRDTADLIESLVDQLTSLLWPTLVADRAQAAAR